MSNILQVGFKHAKIVNRGYSGSGVRICYTPVFIDKISIMWENKLCSKPTSWPDEQQLSLHILDCVYSKTTLSHLSSNCIKKSH